MHQVLVRVGNCENVSERRPQDEARLALTKPGKRGLPDIVLLSEISWLDLHDLCDELGWHAIQHGEKGSPEAGVGIACRVPIESLDMIVGSRATSEGAGGVRLRPIVGGTVPEWDDAPFWSIHAPPPDSPNARAEYIERCRGCDGVIGGDWNREPEWMRRSSTRAYRGDGVLGLLVPRAYNPGTVTTVGIDSDHRAVDVSLWIPERRRDAT